MMRQPMLAPPEIGQAALLLAIEGARDALNDVVPRGFRHPRAPAEEVRFPSFYRKISGHDFWSDWPKPAAQLEVIQARRRIADETEPRLRIDRLPDGGEKSGPKRKARVDLGRLPVACEDRARPGTS